MEALCVHRRKAKETTRSHVVSRASKNYNGPLGIYTRRDVRPIESNRWSKI